MVVFTVIGVVVVALVLALLLVLAALAVLDRIGTIHTCWRRYSVSYPDSSIDPNGPFNTYENHWLDEDTSHFTFRGAARAAKKVRGTRIFDAWDTSYAVARPGWSESANGYVRDRDGF